MPYLECYVGDGGNSEQVLHAVDDGVGGGGHGGVADLKGDGRHSRHTLHELSLHRNTNGLVSKCQQNQRS